MKKLALVTLAFATFMFVACGGGSNQNESNSSEETETGAMDDNASAGASQDDSADAGENVIDLTGNDQMKFNKTDFTVKAGEEVTLKLKNVGELPAEAMSHDAVVLKPGTDFKAFGNAATAAGSISKLGDDEKANIVAETKMLGPGESDEITFTLDEPGEYPFLCTFPGHFMSMNGTITAE